MRPCNLLLWGLLCSIVLEAAILPSSDFIQNIQFDGAQSTAHVMTFTCSDTNPAGTVLVGDYQVDIECLNPVTESGLTELCTIPQSVLAMRNMMCLSTDATAFNEAAQNYLQQAQSFRRRLLSSSDRRLLGPEAFVAGFGTFIMAGVALATATTALYIGLMNSQSIGQLQGDVKNLGISLDATKADAQHALGIASVNQAEISYTQQQVQLFYNSSQAQIAASNSQIAAQNIQIAAIQGLANGTTAGLNALQAQVLSTQQQTAQFINSQTNQTDQRIIELASSVYNMLGILTEQISDIKTDINLVQQNLNFRAAQIESVMSDTVLNNALIQSVHDSLKTIQSDMFAFTTDAGVAPAPLSGIDLRNIQDILTVNYRAASGGNPVYELHSVTLSFYMDTAFGFQQQIQQGQTVVAVQSLPSFFSTPDCQRAYVPPDQSPDATNNIQCQLWMETADNYCLTDISPRFNWTITTPTLQSGYCTQGAIQPAITSIKKTFQSTVDYIAQICQARDPNSPIVLFSARRAISYSINPPSGAACLQAWDTMISNMRQGTQPSLLLEVFVDLQRAWGFANIDLARRRLKLYGQMPGGISVKTEPFFHLPTGINMTNGVPVYDGSATPYRCLQSDFVSVHQNTLPVYSKVIANNPAVVKAVRVTVTPRPGFTCTDASVCYPVGSSLVTSDIIYTSDRPPSTDPLVFVGNLIPDVIQSQGLFDISDDQLGCSSNTRANENTVCYLKFPAGTRQTPTLPEFLQENNNIYDSTKATVSASDYRFPAIFDREGYPLCSNGIPPGALSNITIDAHGCNNPYKYLNATVPSFDWPTDADPAECVQPGTVLLFHSLSDQVYGGSALSQIASGSSVVSFWFQSSLAVSSGAGMNFVVLEIKNSQSTSYLRYMVDSNGMPAVVLSNSATANTGLTMDTRAVGSTGTRILTKNLRDTVLHQVVWRSTVNQYNTGSSTVVYELWIDTIFQGAWKSTTGSYISSTTDPLYSKSALIISTAFANADSVFLGLLNPVSSQVRLANSYACQQAWFNKRCAQSAGSERLLIMLQNVTSNNNIFCDSTSQLVLSTTAFDSLFPGATIIASQLFTTAAWSMGFWIRLPASVSTGQYVLLQNQHTSMKVALNSVTQLLDISVNSVIVASINVQDLDSHNIYISYDGSAVISYLDGKLFGSAVAVTAGSWAPATSSMNFTQGLNYLSMMKRYNRALTANEVFAEMSCQIDSTLSTRSFVPPIGFCEQSLTDPGRGYCRSPLLCAGHCSGYSTIDNSTRTFVVNARNCDDSWADPACVTKCARVDEATGRCVDLAALWAQAPVPLGRMCQSMKDNKVEMNLASMRMYETARQFLYQVTINIPTGIITSVVGSAQCPKLDLMDFGNSGELLATFTNQDTTESNIRVFYAPVVYFNDPVNVECRSECCNANTNSGQLFSIPAGTSASMRVPQCGNMTLVISRLSSVQNVNQYTLCSTLTGESLIQAVNSGNLQQNANLISSVKFTIDNTAESLFEFQKNTNLLTINALILQAGYQNATVAVLEALLRVKNQVSAATYLTYNTTWINFNLSAIVSAELDAAKTELDNARTGLANAQSYLDQIPVLGALINSLADSNRADITALNNTIAAERVELKGLIDSIGSGGIGDPLSAIGGAIKSVVTGIIDDGKSLLQKGLDVFGLGGGGILGTIGSIISTLINVAIIAAIGYAVYLFWGSEFRKNMCKSKKKTKDEPAIKTRRPPDQQRSTQAYFSVRQQI